MIKVTSRIQEKLLSLAESGMGYQFIKATYRGGYSKDAIALNAKVFNRKSFSGKVINYLMKNLSESDEIIDVAIQAGIKTN